MNPPSPTTVSVTPTVSVIIPTRNRASLLQRAVDSVRAQTLPDWECIIVDDFSSDRTPALLKDLCAEDGRFRVLSMPAQSGNTLTRAAGCFAARGEFIAILDDDDWWEPQKLQTQVEAMRAAPDAAWSYHATQLVSVAGVGAIEPTRHGNDFLKRLVQYNWLRHSTMMFRRSAFEAVGGYDRRLPLASDWALALRLTLRFGQHAIVAMPNVLLNYWLHEDQVSSNTRQRTLAERRLVRRALLRDGLLWKHPVLALHMLDKQLDREMHAALSAERFASAFGFALISTLARPFRGWRWQRCFAFGRAMVTHHRPVGFESREATPGHG